MLWIYKFIKILLLLLLQHLHKLNRHFEVESLSNEHGQGRKKIRCGAG